MENNTKTQIEKLVAEMAEKHDYLQALESTMHAARQLSDVCFTSKEVCELHSYRIVSKPFLQKLAQLELNLIFLHETYLHGCDEEFEEEMCKIVNSVAFMEKINLEG